MAPWDIPNLMRITRPSDGQPVYIRPGNIQGIVSWPVKPADERTDGCTLVVVMAGGAAYDIDFPERTADEVWQALHDASLA